MRLLVRGAGGHAKVVVDAALAAGLEIAAIAGAPADPPSLLGHPVVRDGSPVTAEGFVVAIGDNRARARCFEEYTSAGMTPATIVHPSATIGSDVEIGAGTFVAAGVVINTGARVGRDVILNTGCVVEHDVIVGDHAHIAPNAAVCGGARIGEGVLLGVGSCVTPLSSVGAWSIVGAGAAVTRDLPAEHVCVGVPARPVGPVREAQGA